MDRPLLVLTNCIVLLAAGVGFCFWTLYYTDWFPVIGGLLGLTGAFTWVGVFSNLITDERKSALQAWMDRNFLQRAWPCVLVAVVSLAFLFLVAARNGTVVIDAGTDDIGRVARITIPGAADAIVETSSVAGGDSSVLVPTNLFGAQEYQISATGLPSILTTVRAFRRTHVKFPNDLMAAPIILLRPNSNLSGIAVTGGHALKVTAAGKFFGQLEDYRGTTVWLGTTRDVAVPREKIDRWRGEDIDPQMDDARVRETVLARWRNLQASPGAFPLQPGMQVRAAVLSTKDGLTIASACQSVTVPADIRDFPEELVIHDEKDCE
jgi:hypothetical protein